MRTILNTECIQKWEDTCRSYSNKIEAERICTEEGRDKIDEWWVLFISPCAAHHTNSCTSFKHKIQLTETNISSRDTSKKQRFLNMYLAAFYYHHPSNPSPMIWIQLYANDVNVFIFNSNMQKSNGEYEIYMLWNTRPSGIRHISQFQQSQVYKQKIKAYHYFSYLIHMQQEGEWIYKGILLVF